MHKLRRARWRAVEYSSSRDTARNYQKRWSSDAAMREAHESALTRAHYCGLRPMACTPRRQKASGHGLPAAGSGRCLVNQWARRYADDMRLSIFDALFSAGFIMMLLRVAIIGRLLDFRGYC